MWWIFYAWVKGIWVKIFYVELFVIMMGTEQTFKVQRELLLKLFVYILLSMSVG